MRLRMLVRYALTGAGMLVGSLPTKENMTWRQVYLTTQKQY
jgi:hypothetical protein